MQGKLVQLFDLFPFCICWDQPPQKMEIRWSKLTGACFVYSCKDKPRQLGALVLCLPLLPPPLLTPHLPALLPLLNRALLLQVNLKNIIIIIY